MDGFKIKILIWWTCLMSRRHWIHVLHEEKAMFLSIVTWKWQNCAHRCSKWVHKSKVLIALTTTCLFKLYLQVYGAPASSSWVSREEANSHPMAWMTCLADCIRLTFPTQSYKEELWRSMTIKILHLKGRIQT